MCARSTGPESGGTGTTGTPATSPPTIATTVSIVGVATTATVPAPAMRSATAPAAVDSWANDRAAEPIRTAPGGSPWEPVSAGSNVEITRLRCHTTRTVRGSDHGRSHPGRSRGRRQARVRLGRRLARLVPRGTDRRGRARGARHVPRPVRPGRRACRAQAAEDRRRPVRRAGAGQGRRDDGVRRARRGREVRPGEGRPRPWPAGTSPSWRRPGRCSTRSPRTPRRRSGRDRAAAGGTATRCSATWSTRRPGTPARSV